MNRLTTLRETARGRKSRAFTLVELVVVLAIIGILGTVAVFSYVNFFSDANEAKAETRAAQVATSIQAFSLTNNVAPVSITYAIDSNNHLNMNGGTPPADETIPLGTGESAAWNNTDKIITIRTGDRAEQKACLSVKDLSAVGAPIPIVPCPAS